MITGGVLQTIAGFVTQIQGRRFIHTKRRFGLFWSCDSFESMKEEVTCFGSVLHTRVEIKRQKSAIATKTDMTDVYR